MSEQDSVAELVGGPERMEALMRRFYDRLFDDILVGFLFAGRDKEQLIASQIAYIHDQLGPRGAARQYTGPPIRKAHEQLPILAGHFDRRHTLLREVLEEFEVPDALRERWLALDLKLRPLVLRTGSQAVDAILGRPEEARDGGQ